MTDIRYIKTTTAKSFWDPDGRRERGELLWGDRVEVIEPVGRLVKARARGRRVFVDPDDLGDESLLEIYFIDVGQGDGVLIRTPDESADHPDGRHLLIDGGWPRQSQPTAKNASDFVDWKFKKDYRRDVIELDAVICSHNDQDHYGGLWDLLDQNARARAELDSDDVRVEAIYHAGLSWWRPGDRTLGRTARDGADKFFVQLLGDRDSVEHGLDAADPSDKLQGDWARFWSAAAATRTRGDAPTPIERLSDRTGSMPGFDDPAGVDIKVLGPVETTIDGQPAIRRFSSKDSQNTNGNSVMLRVDYGRVRILLTGDLNWNSQDALLRDYDGRHDVFEADVVKACHHGSGDISTRFLKTISPMATIISSGDCESHDHPRPEVVAASGITGTIGDPLPDKLESPLVYITELARSVTLGTPTRIEYTDPSGTVHVIEGDEFEQVQVTYEVSKAGDRQPRTFTNSLKRPDKTTPRQIVDFTTFGLINVRTDGEKIVLAARNEADGTWNTQEIQGRF